MVPKVYCYCERCRAMLTPAMVDRRAIVLHPFTGRIMARDAGTPGYCRPCATRVYAE
jgi:hypothetical protein